MKKPSKSFVNKLTKLVIVLEILIVFSLMVNFSQGYKLKKPFHCEDCNVLLITMDSLRADHVGAYGYERNTTPTIDSLARKGVLFENVIASAPLTFISLPIMISSTKPFLISLNETDSDDNFYVHIFDNVTTIARTLKKNNYQTASIINNDISFTNILKDFNFKEVSNFEDDFLITNKVVKYLKTLKSEKFFLWVHYISPHSSYEPISPYNAWFYKDEIYNSSNQFFIEEQNIIEEVYLNSSDGNFYISQYDGEIRFIDNEIKRLQNYLEKNNLSKNTLVIISSDHGESLGEHDSYFIHGNLYDTDLKIPLIIYNPKSKIKNKRITQQISNIDFYPTILDILKITDKPADLIGKSFYGLIVGIYQKERVAYSLASSTFFSFRMNGWKFIFSNELKELYNLKSDPNELNNIFYNYSSLKSKIDPALVLQIDKALSK